MSIENDANLLSVCMLKTYFYTSMGIIKAVDNVDIVVNRRETVGLVGESGCGKSTLGLSLMRLVPKPGKIIGGKILFQNKDILKLTEKEIRNVRLKEMSMTFQDPLTFLNPVMKIKDQICEKIQPKRRRYTPEIEQRALDILKRVYIQSPKEVLMYYPHQLSGGMRQRVLIAMAIINNPSLLIADEPTTALDVTVQAEILNLIKKKIDESEISLLLITHDLGIVADICKKVYVMYAGQIVENTDVFTLYDEPLHPYTQGLLESIISIDEYKEKLVSIKGSVPNFLNLPSGCRFNPRCKNILQICKEKIPPLYKIKNRMVRCWLYEEEGETIEEDN